VELKVAVAAKMSYFAHTYCMEKVMEKELTLNSNHPFSMLKSGFEQKPELGSEVETAMRGVLTQLNPSDPGARMGFGGAYEWIMAIACCVSGIQTVPGGHSEKGFDLLQYGNNLQGLWSLKSSAQTKPSGEIRLKNKMSSASRVKNNSHSYETPTVFIAPYLPGITYFDPKVAVGYASRIEQSDEAITIKASLIKQFAVDNPGCVIPFQAPENPGSANQVWQLDVVTSILTSGTYPNLGPIMSDMKKNAATVQYLKKQFESGNINEETLNKLLTNLDV
jgi:hypothetical protein